MFDYQCTPYAWWINGRKHRGPEGPVVSEAIGQLILGGFAPRDIKLEFEVCSGSRVDIAAFTSREVLLVECKPRRPNSADRRQASRYLQAARLRWGELQVRAVLAWTTYPDPTFMVDEVVA